MSAADRYPSYRAPQANGNVLCVPPWNALRAAIVDSLAMQALGSLNIAGVTLGELKRSARDALLEEALRYTRSYTDAENSHADEPLILTGHQPELVHPGVWLKNFAAANLSGTVGGTAISLIIDNDLCRTASVRVPSGTVDQPVLEAVPLDEPRGKLPYEERTIVDRGVWNSFGQRATDAISSLLAEPLVSEWWPEVVDNSGSTAQLGLAIAQARHRMEQRWGSRTLEIPQSLVCETEPFLRFAIHLLTNAENVRREYNASLAEYRQAHQVRNSAQPLPDLNQSEDWVETPFWIWSNADPARRALFVKPSAEGWELSDRDHWSGSMPKSSDAMLQQLVEWRKVGIKIRSRALITTLYARLLLSDMFVHGIGGAKYDQVTDLLCERLFGVRPPMYATLSGTLRLPIDHATVPAAREAEIRQRMRELRYHPEKHVSDLSLDPEQHSRVEAWVAKKMKWVQATKSRENASIRHQGIVTANESLQFWLRPKHETLEQQLETATSLARKSQILDSREYSFCLFPRNILHDFVLENLPRMS